MKCSRWLSLSLIAVFSWSMMSGCKKQATPEDARPTQKDVVAYEPPGSTMIEEQLAQAPKRIILFIGDGMGVPAVTAGAYARGERLEMMRMPHVSLLRTHEHEYMTTDSAASATAFATGHKTHFEGVSVRAGTTLEQEGDSQRHLSTLVAAAREAGWRTGLVATSRIVHATPAAFAAHRSHRGSYESIALDMAASGVDVMLGAGSNYFSKREDGKDLLKSMASSGYTIATTREEVLASAGKVDRLVGLIHEKDMPSMSEGGRRMSLAELTQAAIDTLEKDSPAGFFLMVEGSQIDWEEHAMNGEGTVKEVLDFDEAIGTARRWAEGREDTLIVVTADHETGGLAVLDGPSTATALEILGGEEAATQSVAGKGGFPAPIQSIALGTGEMIPAEVERRELRTSFGFLSVASRGLWTLASTFGAAHTAAMVPLFAQGVGASFLAEAIQDNADLGRLLRAMILRETAGALSPVEREILKLKRDIFTPKRARNVILLVGDGMGVAALTASYYHRGHSAMLSMPIKGLVSTHGVDRVVNDSAATATALATGQRTRYGAVGVVPDGAGFKPAESVLERAEAMGLRTGLITTTTLTHATPAAFYAHHKSRKAEDDIARFFVDLPERIPGSDGIDVAFAGGAERFDEALITKLRARGVHVATGWDEVPAPPDQQVVRLLAPRGLPPAKERLAQGSSVPTLMQMTSSALTTLSETDRGFFLMIEGGQIDWAQHELDTGERLLSEVGDFDDAVGEALSFAYDRGDTLVIVTADHDHTLSVLDNHYGFSQGQCGVAKRCGGEVVFQDNTVERVHRGEGFSEAAMRPENEPQASLILQYAWVPQAADLVKSRPGPHSANFVPLFAYGPGAQDFAGMQDQPQVGKKLLEWAASTPQ